MAKTIKWWRERGYATKASLESDIRKITNRWPLDTPISKTETDFLLWVLEHHHEFDEKIGCGLKYLDIRINPSWNGPTRGVWITRIDGTEIDISWVTALKPGGAKAAIEEVRNAAREEIADQIHQAHVALPCDVCSLCGQMLVRGLGVHVDHEVPFAQLFKTFFGDDYKNVVLNDLGLTSVFADRDLAQRWQDFHRENAVLRIVHADCNLRRARG